MQEAVEPTTPARATEPRLNGIHLEHEPDVFDAIGRALELRAPRLFETGGDRYGA